jgi:chorismate lyase
MTLPTQHCVSSPLTSCLSALLLHQIQSVYYGHNAYLEELLGMEGPLWGRQYFFWHQGRPLTLIYEVFSPHLAKYLGPVQSS